MGQEIRRFFPQAGCGVVEGQIQVELRFDAVAIVAHHRRQFFPVAFPEQDEFVTSPEIQAVQGNGLVDQGFGGQLGIQPAEHSGLQVARFEIERVGAQGQFEMLQGGREIVAPAVDFGQRAVPGGLVGVVPGGPVQGGVRFVETLLIFEGQPEVVVRLTVAGVRVVMDEPLDGAAKMLLGREKIAAAQVRQTQGIAGARIVGVPAQDLLPVRLGIEDGMAVLLQVHPGQVAFVVGG